MEPSEAEIRQLAEELASWKDISNWALIPKSVLQHMRGLDTTSKDVSKAAQNLLDKTSELYPDSVTKPSGISELQEALNASKQQRDQAGLIFAYFTEHIDTLTKQAYGELAMDFLKQLKAKVGDRDIAEIVAWTIEEHELNPS